MPMMLLTLVLVRMELIAAVRRKVGPTGIGAYFIMERVGVMFVEGVIGSGIMLEGVIGSGIMLVGESVTGHYLTIPTDHCTVMMIEGSKGVARAGCGSLCLARCLDFLHGRPAHSSGMTTQPSLGGATWRRAAMASSWMEWTLALTSASKDECCA